jgi:hypothetical protein
MAVYKELAVLAQKIQAQSRQIFNDSADYGVYIESYNHPLIKLTKELMKWYEIPVKTEKYATGFTQTFEFDGGWPAVIEAGFEKMKITFVGIQSSKAKGYLQVETWSTPAAIVKAKEYINKKSKKMNNHTIETLIEKLNPIPLNDMEIGRNRAIIEIIQESRNGVEITTNHLIGKLLPLGSTPAEVGYNQAIIELLQDSLSRDPRDGVKEELNKLLNAWGYNIIMETFDHIVEKRMSNEKLYALKAFKDDTGVDLIEAKHFMDAFWDNTKHIVNS